ncbi:MAG: hypothetical protein ABW166_02590 [Sedimenticola sp.]
MSRDDFSIPTKRTLAQRSGGRCSYPGCDKLCWLPGEEPTKAATIGVAAHICAASSDGPRYNESQKVEERKDISNAIYMCQNHAREIDTDEQRFSVELLKNWKDRHESQIRGQADNKWLLPTIEIRKGIGVTHSAEEKVVVTESTIGDRVEHTVTIKNTSDFEIRRIGFTVQYPEFIEHPPRVTGPPGFSHQIFGENMEWEASVQGGGKVESPKVTHYGSFTIEGTTLLQGQSVSLLIRSVPDPHPTLMESEKTMFWVSGELAVNVGTLLEKQSFVAPLMYNAEKRKIIPGYVHALNIEADEYLTLQRAYFV